MVRNVQFTACNVSGRGVSATRHRPRHRLRLRSHCAFVSEMYIIIVCVENDRTMVLQRRKFHHGCRVIAGGNITMSDPQNGI